MTPEEFRLLAGKVADGEASAEEVELFSSLTQTPEGEELQPDAELNKEMFRTIRRRSGLKARRYELPIFRVAVAVIFLCLMSGTFWYLYSRRHLDETPAILAQHSTPASHPVPGSNGAILTLADGSQIILDSANNGALAMQNGTEVIKKNGQLVYQPNQSSVNIGYNTMSTPRGRQFNLVLADGSRVWLNAASSITFPTAFTGPERHVKVNGEAYFEVAHDAKHPFIVEHEDLAVTVLGTSFNINSYEDEQSDAITLIEGSVQVSNESGQLMLKPGMQALANDEAVKLRKDADLESIMAWKNGMFHFKGTDLHTLLRQVGRWYDVEIVFKREHHELFFADVTRDTPLADLLKALELTQKVTFKIEGKTIIVL